MPRSVIHFQIRVQSTVSVDITLFPVDTFLHQTMQIANMSLAIIIGSVTSCAPAVQIAIMLSIKVLALASILDQDRSCLLAGVLTVLRVRLVTY
jgi:hypothetical protein